MKQTIKSLGLWLSVWLMDVAAYVYEISNKIENYSYRLNSISYRNSKQEIDDAENLAFDEDWKCYSELQLKIISKKHGIVPVITQEQIN